MFADAGDTVVRSVHLIGAATWAGALIFLGVAVGVARRTIPDAARVEFFRSLGRRFAVVGGLALLVLIATGIDMTSDRDAWAQLTDTTYGKTLLVKLILVGVVILLTLLHSLFQGPRLSVSESRRPAGRATSSFSAEFAGKVRLGVWCRGSTCLRRSRSWCSPPGS